MSDEQNGVEVQPEIPEPARNPVAPATVPNEFGPLNHVGFVFDHNGVRIGMTMQEAINLRNSIENQLRFLETASKQMFGK